MRGKFLIEIIGGGFGLKRVGKGGGGWKCCGNREEKDNELK